MSLKNIMTNKIIVKNSNCSIYDIAKTMQDNDIGFIPINEKNKIIGVITDRDIVTKLISNNETYDTKIKSYINNNIVSIDINKEIDDVLILMAEKKVKRIIITDKNKVIGIISISDILNKIESDQILNTLKTIYAIERKNDNYQTEVDEFYL